MSTVWNAFASPAFVVAGGALRQTPQSAGLPHVMTLKQFLASAKPPEFLIDRLIQRARLHTLTGLTYHGKATVMAYMILCVAYGMDFAGHHAAYSVPAQASTYGSPLR
jgi:hypothetical protein